MSRCFGIESEKMEGGLEEGWGGCIGGEAAWRY